MRNAWGFVDEVLESGDKIYPGSEGETLTDAESGSESAHGEGGGKSERGEGAAVITRSDLRVRGRNSVKREGWGGSEGSKSGEDEDSETRRTLFVCFLIDRKKKAGVFVSSIMNNARFQIYIY